MSVSSRNCRICSSATGTSTCSLSHIACSICNIVVSSDPEHLVTTIGVSDMIIVHTRDATMVCPKSEAQRVKELVGKVKEKYGERYQ